MAYNTWMLLSLIPSGIDALSEFAAVSEHGAWFLTKAAFLAGAVFINEKDFKSISLEQLAEADSFGWGVKSWMVAVGPISHADYHTIRTAENSCKIIDHACLGDLSAAITTESELAEQILLVEGSQERIHLVFSFEIFLEIPKNKSFLVAIAEISLPLFGSSVIGCFEVIFNTVSEVCILLCLRFFAALVRSIPELLLVMEMAIICGIDFDFKIRVPFLREIGIDAEQHISHVGVDGDNLFVLHSCIFNFRQAMDISFWSRWSLLHILCELLNMALFLQNNRATNSISFNRMVE